MGNPDLAVIVNSMAFIIRGTSYIDEKDAIDIAMCKFYDEYDKRIRYLESCGNAEDDFPSIETIEKIMCYQIFA